MHQKSRSYSGRIEYEQHVSKILAFYVGCLSDTVGSDFQPPSLGILATFWVSSFGALTPPEPWLCFLDPIYVQMRYARLRG